MSERTGRGNDKDEERKKAMDDHIAKVVAAWPPPTPAQVHRVTVLLMGGSASYHRNAEPSPEMIAVRKAEESLAKLRREFSEALEGCHGCGLTRKVHTYQSSYGAGYHAFADLSPDGAIKVAQAYKKKIAAAEKELARVNAA